MTSPRAQSLIEAYETNTWLIHHHVDGVTDEESLLQLPFQANCLNWIVGHIVSRRNSAMEALGLPGLWNEKLMSKYKTNSEPITGPDGARRFGDLMADLDESHNAIVAALEGASGEALDRVVVNDRGEKRAVEHLEGFHWHETYHAGQLDLLQAYIHSRREPASAADGLGE